MRRTFLPSLLPVFLGVAHAIRGGQIAAPGQFPSLASVSQRSTPSRGGVILNTHSILTTASCVDQASAIDLRVRVGSLSLRDGGQSLSVSRIAIHPSYRKGSASNDVAILFTFNQIQPTLLTQYATLASRVPTDSTALFTIAGWGPSSPGEPPQQQLQYARSRAYGKVECELQRPGQLDVLTRSTFCISNSYHASCGIDHGGPVFYNGEVVGLISDVGCRDGTTISDLVVSVPSLLGWINYNQA
jgi:secreted trypsin-like serine protease